MDQKKYAKCVCCGAIWHISVYQKGKNYYCPWKGKREMRNNFDDPDIEEIISYIFDF